MVYVIQYCRQLAGRIRMVQAGSGLCKQDQDDASRFRMELRSILLANRIRMVQAGAGLNSVPA
jgi:hypothetical protein